LDEQKLHQINILTPLASGTGTTGKKVKIQEIVHFLCFKEIEEKKDIVF